jgi:hypothetical protein|tara:strand:- start:96 stop:962 length:867 start_codon:yes stop_codon:yes gene_type:complete
MYFPSSQVELNLTSNGDLVYKGSKVPYYGTYFATSKGKYYTNNPGNAVLRELEKAIPEEPSDQQQGQPGNFSNWVPDKRFDGFVNKSYSFLKNAPEKSPVVTPPPFQPYIPNTYDYVKGYSNRYFAKKTTSNLYIEISSVTYKKLKKSDPTTAFMLYEARSFKWYLDSNSDLSVEEINSNNAIEFETSNNWPYFKDFLNIYPETPNYSYTKGNEFLLPNRTSYIGYYHVMPDGKIMAGKSHNKGRNVVLISLKTPPTPDLENNESLSASPPPSSTTSTSSPSTGGGGY